MAAAAATALQTASPSLHRSHAAPLRLRTLPCAQHGGLREPLPRVVHLPHLYAPARCDHRVHDLPFRAARAKPTPARAVHANHPAAGGGDALTGRHDRGARRDAGERRSVRADAGADPPRQLWRLRLAPRGGGEDSPPVRPAAAPVQLLQLRPRARAREAAAAAHGARPQDARDRRHRRDPPALQGGGRRALRDGDERKGGGRGRCLQRSAGYARARREGDDRGRQRGHHDVRTPQGCVASLRSSRRCCVPRCRCCCAELATHPLSVLAFHSPPPPRVPFVRSLLPCAAPTRAVVPVAQTSTVRSRRFRRSRAPSRCGRTRARTMRSSSPPTRRGRRRE